MMTAFSASTKLIARGTEIIARGSQLLPLRSRTRPCKTLTLPNSYGSRWADPHMAGRRDGSGGNTRQLYSLGITENYTYICAGALSPIQRKISVMPKLYNCLRSEEHTSELQSRQYLV